MYAGGQCSCLFGFRRGGGWQGSEGDKAALQDPGERWSAWQETVPPAAKPGVSLSVNCSPGMGARNRMVTVPGTLSVALGCSSGAPGESSYFLSFPGELGQQCPARRHWVSRGTWDQQPPHSTLWTPL